MFLIFDMDGVIVNSNETHKKAWQEFCRTRTEKPCAEISEEALRKEVYGKTNADALRYIYGGSLSDEEAKQYAADKEALYRDLFKPTMKPTAGLVAFLQEVQTLVGKPAIATSAPIANLDFVLDTLNLRPYFSVIVNDTMVQKGKPDPEIYLKTAELLQANPKDCIVFEDSLAGIESAKRAGMKVIAITTTHSRDELEAQADWVIDDFDALAQNIGILEQVLAGDASVAVTAGKAVHG